MKKDKYVRLDGVIDDISSPAYTASLFSGFKQKAVSRVVFKDVDKLDLAALMELSGLLSFGGARLIKRADETDLRRLKRLLLLFHRVPGYHSHFESYALKQTILNQTKADVMPRAKYEVGRALRFMTDEDLWGRDIAMRHGGVMTHYYNQGRDNRLNDFDKTENGWCLGMSVHWLACRAQKIEFWDSHLSEQGAAKYRFVMAAQGVRAATGTTSDRASFRLKKYGLKLDAVKSEDSDEAGEHMAALITGGGNFVRIGQYYVGGGGHAMAATLEQGGVRFMDPNLGEFLFKLRTGFAAWYPLFLRKMGYRFTKYYVESYSLSPGQAAPPQELKDALAGRRAAMGYDE